LGKKKSEGKAKKGGNADPDNGIKPSKRFTEREGRKLN